MTTYVVPAPLPSQNARAAFAVPPAATYAFSMSLSLRCAVCQVPSTGEAAVADGLGDTVVGTGETCVRPVLLGGPAAPPLEPHAAAPIAMSMPTSAIRVIASLALESSISSSSVTHYTGTIGVGVYTDQGSGLPRRGCEKDKDGSVAEVPIFRFL